jgi:sugar phosphate isomerase/epimerase
MIGLSTYAFFWQHSSLAPHPLDLPAMLRRTREQGVDLFQICDYAPLESMTDAELADIRSLANELGLTLELGTRGLGTDHLERYLVMAGILGARLVRSMVNTASHQPTLDEAAGLLGDVMPAYDHAGVVLALETYEQVSTRDLVGLVERVGNPHLGICLDPANTVARLENPRDVIDATAAHVVNIHVKDFTFSRKDGWVGFSLIGARLGEGLLPYDHLMAAVRPDERGVNQVIEHWLPTLGSINETLQAEQAWTTHNLNYLRSKRS